MGRTKEAPRGRLATLQDMLAGGGRVLADQAQSLTAGVQRGLAASEKEDKEDDSPVTVADYGASG